jgi:Hydrazine synthase alpha subunit middle domain
MNPGTRTAATFLACSFGFASILTTVALSKSAPKKGPDESTVFVQAPAIATGELIARFPQGSRLVRMSGKQAKPSVVDLTPEFFTVADPQVSFDGTLVLFAGQKTSQDHWQVWEMRLDGSEKRQITHCSEDCLRPAYLSHGEIVLTAATRQGSSTSSQVMVTKLDGSDLHPITFGPGDFVVETVLRDGRILVSARSPLLPGGGNEVSRNLYTVRLDGTSLEIFRSNSKEQIIRKQARELDDGSVVFIKQPLSGNVTEGELAMIRRGAPHNSSLAPTLSLSWPSALPGTQTLLVAREERSPRSKSGKFDLYTFDLTTNKLGARIFGDSTQSSIQPVPVAAHRQPRWYWSTVNPKIGAGYFVCLDSHITADAPNGRFVTPIARVRILTLDAVTNREHALGDAPVERDGSFYVAVPPDVPVRFELLDAQGKMIHAQRSWIWARSGDEFGCVGCHDDKSVAPPNRWPLTLRRFDTPTQLGVKLEPSPAHREQ